MLTYLWHRGIRTAGSCQDQVAADGSHGTAVISFNDFESMDSAVAALAFAAAQAEHGAMFLRATQQPSPGRFYGPVGSDRMPVVVRYERDMWSMTYKSFWWLKLGMNKPLETRYDGYGSVALWLPAADVVDMAGFLPQDPPGPGEGVWPVSSTPLPPSMMFFINAES